MHQIVPCIYIVNTFSLYTLALLKLKSIKLEIKLTLSVIDTILPLAMKFYQNIFNI